MTDRIKAVIVDDEMHCIETLQWQLANYCPQVDVVDTFISPVKSLKFLMYHEIDLLFLDVEMPVLNGFDLLHALPKKDFALVFTTAYDEFAIKAIKHHAIDYLLKPIDRQELEQAVRTALQSKMELENRLEELMKEMEIDTHTKIAIPTPDGVELVDKSEIIHCESDSNYTHVYSAEGRRYTVAKTLKEIEEQIDSDQFIRVHQSHLVNFNHVERYHKSEGGKLIMSDQTEIPVSRRKRTELIERLH
ncbi:MAG: response regulator transcription factor [Flavobacteriales bacterium]|nr:response regulator transcription factor [Flavobacteriales bacterium]